MRTKTKALVTALCAVLLVVASVMGTMAYLTSQDTVTNTFTVGNVKITLDEKDVDKDQNTADNVTLPTGEVRDKANKYHLIPGNTYVKDPKDHVDANSENCWLFVKLQNGLNAIVDNTTIEAQMVANGWTVLDAANNIYAYKDIVAAGANKVVFESFKLKGDAEVARYANADITVTAYAVQADNFATAQAAWEAAKFPIN